MDKKDFQLYQEENRQALIDLNEGIKDVKTLLDTSVKQYKAPSDKIQVNTEKSVEVANFESIKDYFDELALKLDTTIKSNSYKPKEEVTVKNIKDALPKTIEVSNLEAIKSYFDSVAEAVKNNQPIVNVTKQEVVFPTSASKPIAVRLSDGSKFYKALEAMLTSGGGSPTIRTSSGAIAVPVVNPDGTDIGGGGGSAAYSDSGGTDRKGLVDADRHVQTDVLSSALPTGAATSANQQTDALTDAELRATPVPTTESNRYAVDGDDELIVHQKSASHAQADGASNTRQVSTATDETALIINEAYPYYFNGTTWDRVRGDATNGQLVNLGANNDVTVTSGTITAVPQASVVSTVNSTTTPLADNATFTGTWEDVTDYDFIEATLYTTHDSATNGAVVQLSTDGGTTTEKSLANTLTGGVGAFGYSIPVTAYTHFRIVYTNGSTTQTAFRLRVVKQKGAAPVPIAPIGAGIDATYSGMLTRSVVAGQLPSGAVSNLGVTAAGALKIDVAQHDVDTPIKALTAIKATQATIATTATQITASPLASRKTVSIKLKAAATQKVYVGHDNTVTTSTGYELNAGDSVDIEVDATATIWAIADTSSQTVCILEAS